MKQLNWLWLLLASVICFSVKAQSTDGEWPSAASIKTPANQSSVSVGVPTTVSWEQDGGVPGTSWKLLVDGVQVGGVNTAISNSTNKNGTTKQTGSVSWTPSVQKVSYLAVALCNGNNCIQGQSSMVIVNASAPGKATMTSGNSATVGQPYTLSWGMTGGSAATSWQALVDGVLVGTAQSLTGTGTGSQAGTASLYLKAGSRTVAVRLSNASGSTDSDPITVTVVGGLPSAPTVVTPQDNATVNVGQTTTVSWLQDGGVPGTSWKLFVDGGQVGAVNTTISNSTNANGTTKQTGGMSWTPNVSGTVYLSVALCGDGGGGCTQGQAITVKVVDPKPGKARVTSGSAVTAGQPYTLSWGMTGGSAATSWQALVNGVLVGTAQSLTGTGTGSQAGTTSLFLNAGSYTVAVRLSNASGSTDSDPITVTAADGVPSAPTVVTPQDNAIVNVGQATTVSWLQDGGVPGKSWKLLVNGGQVGAVNTTISSSTNPNGTTKQTGSMGWTPNVGGIVYLSVALCGDGGGGCTQGQAITVRVVDPKPGKATMTSGNSATVGQPYTLSWGMTSGSAATSWQALVNGVLVGTAQSLTGTGTGSQAGTTSLFLNAGSYTVAVRLSNASGSTDSDPITVTAVGGVPSAPTVVTPQDNAIVNVGQATTVSWLQDGGVPGTSWKLLVNGEQVGAVNTTISSSTNANGTTKQTGSMGWTPNVGGIVYLSVALCGDGGGGGCTQGQAITVRVADPKPGKARVTSGNSATVGQPYTLSWGMTSGSAATSWQALVDGVLVGAAQNLTGTGNQAGSASLLLNAGSRTVAVRLSNASGSTDSDPITVTVGANAQATLNITAPPAGSTIQVGSKTTVSWVQNGGEAVQTWQFYVNEKLQNLSPISIKSGFNTDGSLRQSGDILWSPDSAGDYRIRIDSCINVSCTAGNTISVQAVATPSVAKIVSPLPTTNIILGNTVTVNWQKTQGDSAVSWKFFVNRVQVGGISSVITTVGTQQTGSVNWTPNSIGSHILRVDLCNNVGLCTVGEDLLVNVSGTAALPPKAVLTSQKSTVQLQNPILLSWSTATANAASSWELWENGVKLEQSSVFDTVSLGQSGSVSKIAKTGGVYTYYVRLCNATGCTDSNAVTVKVDSPSSEQTRVNSPNLKLSGTKFLAGTPFFYQWVISGGGAPSEWRIYVDQQITGNYFSFTSDATGWQGQGTLQNLSIGLHSLKVEVCNALGCRASDPVAIEIVASGSGMESATPQLRSLMSATLSKGGSFEVRWDAQTTQIAYWRVMHGAQALTANIYLPAVSGQNFQFDKTIIEFKNPGLYNLAVETCSASNICNRSRYFSITVVDGESGNIPGVPPSTPILSFQRGQYKPGDVLSLSWQSKNNRLPIISWEFYNGLQLLQKGIFQDSTQTNYQAFLQFAVPNYGSFDFQLKVCNRVGCSESNVASLAITPNEGSGALVKPGTPVISQSTPPRIKTNQMMEFSWSTPQGVPGRQWQLLQSNTGYSELTPLINIDENFNPRSRITYPLSFTSAGTKQVVVRSCNSIGCTDSSPIFINVTVDNNTSYPTDYSNQNRTPTNPGIQNAGGISNNPLLSAQSQSGATGMMSSIVAPSVVSAGVSTSANASATMTGGNQTQATAVAAANQVSPGGFQRSGMSGNLPTLNMQSSSNNIDLTKNVESIFNDDSLKNQLPPTPLLSAGGVSRTQATQVSGIIPMDVDPFSKRSSLDDLAKNQKSAPGKPVIAIPKNSENTVYSTSRSLLVNWSRWEGGAATNWSLMVNGSSIVMNAALNVQSVQSGQSVVPYLNPGMNSILVQVCNSFGCTMSDPWVIQAQNSGIDERKLPPDMPIILPLTAWSADEVIVSWRAGSRAGNTAQIMINGAPVGEKMLLQPSLNQSATQRVAFPKRQAMNNKSEISVSVMLCNELGCANSQPMILKSL